MIENGMNVVASTKMKNGFPALHAHARGNA